MIKKRKELFLKITLPLLVILVIGAVAFFFTFLGYEKCADYSCFSSALSECSRATYIDDDIETTWGYRIIGERDGKCVIKVTALLLKQGRIESVNIQGKEMECSLSDADINLMMQSGKAIKPHHSLKNCHGVLKEELQEMVIRNLYGVVVENLGEVQAEMLKQI